MSITLPTLRRYISTLVGPMMARLETSIQRVVIKAVDDAKKAQLVTVTALAGDSGDEIEHAQPFGLSFRPTRGAEGIAVSVGAEAAYRIALAVQDRNLRPAESVGEGEGGLYARGAYLVFLDGSGVVHLGAQSAAEKVAVASKVDAEFSRIWDFLTASDAPTPWTPVPQDGGASLIAAASSRASSVQATGSDKVRCEP